jgi:hypothetical protein
MWVRRVQDGEEELEKQMEAAAAAAEEEEGRRRRRRRHFSRAYRLPRGLLPVGPPQCLQCLQCLPQVYL